ncbi:MAG TPA: hypothetical protein VFR86_25675 [Burkholderiaceae bacterium]|nr:hypothetical protein [Burkholderiaceae bacterium]
MASCETTARRRTTIALVAAILTGVVVLGYVRSLGGTHDVEHARTMAMVAGMTG